MKNFVDTLLKMSDITKRSTISRQDWPAVMRELDKRYVNYRVINDGEIELVSRAIRDGVVIENKMRVVRW